MDDFVIFGRHTHVWRDNQWITALPSGKVVEGVVPDPNLKLREANEVELGDRPAPEGVKRELFHFKVMFSGWECDEDGWVVEMEDGSRALVLMSHMSLYIAEESELVEKLAEYDAVIKGTKKALRMLRAGTNPQKNG